MDLCCKIQDANPNESYIKFLMTQKDTKGRTSFHISSQYGFYRILESPEVGAIVHKMWEGRTSPIGLLGASSINNFLIGNTKSLNPIDEFDKIDETRVYSFQLDVWKDSCSIRYWPEFFSTILLILLYNIFIFSIVENRQVITPFFELSFGLQLMGFIYIAWVGIINLRIISQYFFCKWSNRDFNITGWQILEIVMMVCAILILLDVQIVLGKSDGTNDIPYLVRACILALNDILVWLRITGILLTWESFGPLIRMIYLMVIMLLQNLVIFAMYVICCAFIYNSLFYKANPDGFGSFSLTITNLIGMFISNFTMFGFKYYELFGSIMVTIFVTFSGIILINLLIASLTNVYTELSKVVDAAHRSVLIGYYRKYKWDSENGYLIFLSSPLNFLNLFIMPFTCCVTDSNKKKLRIKRKKFNNVVCKVLFSIYFLPLFIWFFIETLFVIPFTYFKGVITCIIFNYRRNETFCKKFGSIIFWFFCGFFYLFGIWGRDIFYILKLVNLKVDVKVNEIERMKKFITPEDVIIFLKYIHNMKTTDINDLHHIFMNYLLFEYEEKAKVNENIRQSKIYMETIKKAMGENQKSGTFTGSIMMNEYSRTVKKPTATVIEDEEENQAKENQKSESSIIMNSYIKKNLIIIEILENFLIADGTDNRIVDIEKMQRLLPKSRNIDHQYIERLLYTNITSLNKALNTIKKGKNELVRELALKKILLNAELIDMSIDEEISTKRGVVMEQVLDEFGKPRGSSFQDPHMELEIYSDMYKFLDKITADIKFLKDNEERELKEQKEREEQERLEKEKEEDKKKEHELIIKARSLVFSFAGSSSSMVEVNKEIEKRGDGDQEEHASLREYHKKECEGDISFSGN